MKNYLEEMDELANAPASIPNDYLSEMDALAGIKPKQKSYTYGERAAQIPRGTLKGAGALLDLVKTPVRPNLLKEEPTIGSALKAGTQLATQSILPSPILNIFNQISNPEKVKDEFSFQETLPKGIDYLAGRSLEPTQDDILG